MILADDLKFDIPKVIKDLGLYWKGPKRVETKNGPKYVINANGAPDALFWKEWKEKKQELKEAGLSLSKDNYNGEWSICIWKDLPKEEKESIEKAVNASKASDTDLDIPSPEGLEYLPYQRAGIAYALERENVLIGDEMGCISGEAIISINRAGGTRKIKLKDAYLRFNGKDRENWNWNKEIPTFVKSLCGDHFSLNRVKKIMYKGIKEVVLLSLEDGKSINLTPDHEVLLANGKWIEAGELKKGDKIIVNDVPVCFKPKPVKVKSVTPVGKEEVYDIVMDDPYRNFVANEILVHNCGKTIQALGLINTDSTVEKVLIFCPSSLRLNWKREAERWLVRDFKIEVIKNGKDYPSDFDILIINYDVARKHRKALENISWDLIILDECHMLKDSRRQRTSAILGKINNKKPEESIKPLSAKRWVALSGTPIPNRPKELWPLLEIIDPNGLGKNFWAFHKKFCNAYKGQYAWDLDGSSNLDILQRILRENCMVRRLKSEVLPELPEKIRRVIELPNDEKRAEGEWNSYRKHQNHIDEIEAKMELAKADENENEYRRQVDALKSAMNFAFEAMASIRHETALYKIPAAIEFIKDALEGGPIVCFAHHKKVIEALKEAFPNSSVLVGDTPLDKRQQAVDDFQSGKTDLFIGSIKAVGLGNTLTASSHAVFIEGDWTPSWVFQAEDRLHRIGQKNSVLIDHLVLEDSIECHIAKTMLDKQRVIELALDKGDILSFLKEEPIVPTKRKRIIYSADEEINLTEEQINNIHHAVQIVAGMCDGAIARDGSGFNAFDTSIGKSLAGRVALTKKQAKLAQGLVQKYQGQLPIELVKSCDIIPKEEKKK